jgi:DNA modification methylase
VWNIPKDNANDYVHATQKPIKLSATAIENTTNENDIILDVFGGSGSTLIACELLDRTCYMMELDPKYCDVIIKRWETLTGEKAVLIND